MLPAKASWEVRGEALRLLMLGHSARQVARMMGVSSMAISRWAKTAGVTLNMGARGGVTQLVYEQHRDDEWLDSAGRLTRSGRVILHVRRREGRSNAAIARELGVHRSTVGRELARNSHAGSYNPHAAHHLSTRRRARPRSRKLDDPVVRAFVIARLNEKFSPEQVSHELRTAFVGRDDKQVSHETIYQALYVRGKGALRHELSVEKALRSGRRTRRPQSKLPTRRGARSWIGDAHISTRPHEVQDRAVPGHWEGDLVIGRGGRSALITLVERQTRFVMIHRLPGQHDSTTVSDALVTMIGALPMSLRKSLTWDRGSEMRHHARFSIATDCGVYFCDPHSPWQRGSNENTNGLIRDFYPKGTDFRDIPDDDIARTAHLLNIR
ncbi:IS30 family transposase, partial [Dermacoccus barathri]|uniref:IS30 family transposase n=2 Tax=Dermacoccus barathri TaxID=322601 RepID=UPI0039E98E86